MATLFALWFGLTLFVLFMCLTSLILIILSYFYLVIKKNSKATTKLLGRKIEWQAEPEHNKKSLKLWIGSVGFIMINMLMGMLLSPNLTSWFLEGVVYAFALGSFVTVILSLRYADKAFYFSDQKGFAAINFLCASAILTFFCIDIMMVEL